MTSECNDLHCAKWVLFALCLTIAALIAIPILINSMPKADITYTSEAEPVSGPNLSYTDDDLALPTEPVLTDEAKVGIVDGLTSTDKSFGIEPRWKDIDLNTVTIGLPVAYYYLYGDDSGTFELTSAEIYQLYPLYIDGKLDCLVQHSNIIVGMNSIFDYDAGEMPNDHFKVLFERLKNGTAGSVAVILAKDGVYLFDGSEFELVSNQGIPDFEGSMSDDNTEPILHHVSLANANLPDELVAEIRITDTSVTEPII